MTKNRTFRHGDNEEKVGTVFNQSVLDSNNVSQ